MTAGIPQGVASAVAVLPEPERLRSSWGPRAVQIQETDALAASGWTVFRFTASEVLEMATYWGWGTHLRERGFDPDEAFSFWCVSEGAESPGAPRLILALPPRPAGQA